MMEYNLRLTGKVVQITPEELVCQGDGVTRIRHGAAFKRQIFHINDKVHVQLKNILDKNFVSSIIKHPTKVWYEPESLKFIGVINTIGFAISSVTSHFDIKPLKENEDPFWRVFKWEQIGWMSNDRYLDDLDLNVGDIIQITIKKMI